MEFNITILRPGDHEHFKSLLKVFATVFEREDSPCPPRHYLESLLKRRDFFCIIASHDQEVIGGLTVHLLPSYYSENDAAYIYDVGVLPSWQRKGAGKKLIEYLVQLGKEKKFQEIFVQAEADDREAIQFYRSTQLTSEINCIQFSRQVL